MARRRKKAIRPNDQPPLNNELPHMMSILKDMVEDVTDKNRGRTSHTYNVCNIESGEIYQVELVGVYDVGEKIWAPCGKDGGEWEDVIIVGVPGDTVCIHFEDGDGNLIIHPHHS